MIDLQHYLGKKRMINVPVKAIQIFYTENNLELLTEQWASSAQFRAEFRYLFIQKNPVNRSTIEQKSFFIWKHKKFRTRILVPMIRNNQIVGSELLAYFPYRFNCGESFSASHIIRIGYFNYSAKNAKRNPLFYFSKKNAENDRFACRIFHSDIQL